MIREGMKPWAWMEVKIRVGSYEETYQCFEAQGVMPTKDEIRRMFSGQLLESALELAEMSGVPEHTKPEEPKT